MHHHEERKSHDFLQKHQEHRHSVQSTPAEAFELSIDTGRKVRQPVYRQEQWHINSQQDRFDSERYSSGRMPCFNFNFIEAVSQTHRGEERTLRQEQGSVPEEKLEAVCGGTGL